MRKVSVFLIFSVSTLLFTIIILGCGRRKEETEVKENKIKQENIGQKGEVKEETSLEKLKEVISEQDEVQTYSSQEEEVVQEEVSENILLIADFNSGKKPNKLGGDFGAWDKDPKDFTQTAIDSFVAKIRHADEGYSIQIRYDVLSSEAAYNGFWMDLKEVDASNYNKLNFWVKGDAERGYTKVFKVELKNSKGEVGKVYITGLIQGWQKITIPLSDFKQLTDFSALKEFVIVFEDRIATSKEGAIYIDDIYLSK